MIPRDHHILVKEKSLHYWSTAHAEHIHTHTHTHRGTHNILVQGQPNFDCEFAHFQSWLEEASHYFRRAGGREGRERQTDRQTNRDRERNE